MPIFVVQTNAVLTPDNLCKVLGIEYIGQSAFLGGQYIFTKHLFPKIKVQNAHFKTVVPFPDILFERHVTKGNSIKLRSQNLGTLQSTVQKISNIHQCLSNISFWLLDEYSFCFETLSGKLFLM